MKSLRNMLLVFGAMLLLAACQEIPENVISKDYLLVPTANKGTRVSMALMIDGENVLGVNQSIILPDSGMQPEFYIPVPVGKFKGKTFELLLTTRDGAQKEAVITQTGKYEYEYNEPYRPIYHFSPDWGWTNDPNGMVYYDGEYHLAYQFNPYGTRHGNMHWGHAITKDLMHWQDMPLIIAPDSLGSVFSGSAVLDADGTAGFGKNAIVGMYTSAGRGGQRQSIAYSLDKGRTYTKYEGNPVLPGADRQPNFRDPKIVRVDDSWVVAIAAGDVITFYSSKNLKDWTFLSDFGKEMGSHGGVWECPELMKFDYQGQEKWVLLVSINPGGPNGGSVTQYFIGDFDGKEFKADDLPYPLWLDEGTDNYAGVTFSNTGDRHIFLGWMSNWYYTQNTPSQYFRNAMTIPRDLSLKDSGEHLILASVPSKEVYASRGTKNAITETVNGGKLTASNLFKDNKGAYELELTITPEDGDKVSLRLYNEKGEQMLFTLDFEALTITLDRTKSGFTAIEKGFSNSEIVGHLIKRSQYDLQLFVDKHSTELFIGNGDLSFTNTMFPSAVYNSLEIQQIKGQAEVSDLAVYEMK